MLFLALSVLSCKLIPKIFARADFFVVVFLPKLKKWFLQGYLAPMRAIPLNCNKFKMFAIVLFCMLTRKHKNRNISGTHKSRWNSNNTIAFCRLKLIKAYCHGQFASASRSLTRTKVGQCLNNPTHMEFFQNVVVFLKHALKRSFKIEYKREIFSKFKHVYTFLVDTELEDATIPNIV